MNTVRKIRNLNALVLSCLLLLTGFATKIVARDSGASTNEADDTNREKVISRLKKVGYSKEDAIDRVDKMTADEIAYFSQHPESIKRSGFVLLASSIGSSVYSSISNADKKRKAYISFLNSKIAGYRTDVTILDGNVKNEKLLIAMEKDTTVKAVREESIKSQQKDIQSKQDLIKSLETEIESIRTKKQPVPKNFQ